MTDPTRSGPMKIAMFIDGLDLELADYTTTVLARELTGRGHRVWYVELEGFAYDPDDLVRARACRVPDGDYPDDEAYLAALRGDDAVEERIEVAGLDVLMLRNDPSVAAEESPWTQDVGILFGQVAARRGVLVLNDPGGLAEARNKLYFQSFPREVRPRTLITRDADQIRRFVDDMGGSAVLKPLRGSGGKSVFVIREGSANLTTMIETVGRHGYVIVQEYLAAAAEGDTRLFLVNGRPLQVDGRYAAMRRVTPEGEARSNITAGAEVKKAEIGDTELRLAELVRPKLVQDGMFFVGLDIAGDRMMEVNVFTPGGIFSIERLEGLPFAAAVVDALERKVELRNLYRSRLTNRELATL